MKSLERAKIEHIVKVINAKEGNKTSASRDLGISVKSVYNAIEAQGDNLLIDELTGHYFFADEIPPYKKPKDIERAKKKVTKKPDINDFCNRLIISKVKFEELWGKRINDKTLNPDFQREPIKELCRQFFVDGFSESMKGEE